MEPEENNSTEYIVVAATTDCSSIIASMIVLMKMPISVDDSGDVEDMGGGGFPDRGRKAVSGPQTCFSASCQTPTAALLLSQFKIGKSHISTGILPSKQ